MPRKKNSTKQSATAKRPTKRSRAKTAPGANQGLVFLNVPTSLRLRSALNRLVDVMEVQNQRQVIEQLVTEELHRRNLRLPRAEYV